MHRRVLAMVQPAGKGTRLYPLPRDRAITAVPFDNRDIGRNVRVRHAILDKSAGNSQKIRDILSMRPYAACRHTAAVLILSACAAFGQTAPQAFTLSTIDFSGLQEIQASEAIAASGLRSGQRITIADLQAATQKLSGTGFFQNVSYVYRHNLRKMDVSFQVEELQAPFPCIFDNFVWFSHEELIQGIRRKEPLFHGRLPKDGAALPRIVDALTEYVRSRRIEGTISTFPKTDLKTRQMQGYLFQITGVPLPIRSLNFRGATGIPEAVLQEKSRPLLGQAYSMTFIADFALQNLAPLFRQQGYLRIQFHQPEAVARETAGSETAVDVTLGLAEGIRYRWEPAIWAGDSPLAPEEMDRMLGMQSGDAADGPRMDRGIETIRAAMEKNGYLEARALAEPDFHDAGNSVQMTIQITRGPRYTLGSINFRGLPDALVSRLKSKWRMGIGDAFDPGYVRQYAARDILAEIVQLRPKRLHSSIFADTRTHSVHVTFESR